MPPTREPDTPRAATLTMTLVGGFPQQLDVTIGTTIAIGAALVTVTHISSRRVVLSLDEPERPTAAFEITPDIPGLVSGDAPLAAFAIDSIS